jgi:hypothetical protein
LKSISVNPFAISSQTFVETVSFQTNKMASPPHFLSNSSASKSPRPFRTSMRATDTWEPQANTQRTGANYDPKGWLTFLGSLPEVKKLAAMARKSLRDVNDGWTPWLMQAEYAWVQALKRRDAGVAYDAVQHFYGIHSRNRFSLHDRLYALTLAVITQSHMNGLPKREHADKAKEILQRWERMDSLEFNTELTTDFEKTSQNLRNTLLGKYSFSHKFQKRPHDVMFSRVPFLVRVTYGDKYKIHILDHPGLQLAIFPETREKVMLHAYEKSGVMESFRQHYLKNQTPIPAPDLNGHEYPHPLTVNLMTRQDFGWSNEPLPETEEVKLPKAEWYFKAHFRGNVIRMNKGHYMTFSSNHLAYYPPLIGALMDIAATHHNPIYFRPPDITILQRDLMEELKRDPVKPYNLVGKHYNDPSDPKSPRLGAYHKVPYSPPEERIKLPKNPFEDYYSYTDIFNYSFIPIFSEAFFRMAHHPLSYFPWETDLSKIDPDEIIVHSPLLNPRKWV